MTIVNGVTSACQESVLISVPWSGVRPIPFVRKDNVTRFVTVKCPVKKGIFAVRDTVWTNVCIPNVLVITIVKRENVIPFLRSVS
jgi:hypothetical protein